MIDQHFHRGPRDATSVRQLPRDVGDLGGPRGETVEGGHLEDVEDRQYGSLFYQVRCARYREQSELIAPIG
jgi:hypothetical protein